jgi:chromosome segregation ATPase
MNKVEKLEKIQKLLKLAGEIVSCHENINSLKVQLDEERSELSILEAERNSLFDELGEKMPEELKALKGLL